MIVNTVKLLHFYRKSIVRDERAFLILHALYKNDTSLESDLVSETGMEVFQIKSAVRDLYNANLINVEDRESYSLTSFAQSVLCELGADKVVLPFLISEVADESDFGDLNWLANTIVELEPSHATWLSNSYKTLKRYLSDNAVSEEDRRRLVWASVIHPDSKIRVLFKNPDVPRDALTSWVFSISQENFSPSVHISVRIDNAMKALDASDAFIFECCASEKISRKLDITFVHHLTSLRFWNFASSASSRDHLLEACIRSSPRAAGTIYDAVSTENTSAKFLEFFRIKMGSVWKKRWGSEGIRNDLKAFTCAALKEKTESQIGTLPDHWADSERVTLEDFSSRADQSD